MQLCSGKSQGFTLIEIVIIIVVLGLLAAVSIPKFQLIHVEGKKSAVKSALGGFRSAIYMWQSKQIAGGGASAWPELTTLSTVGEVMSESIPENPFQLPTNAPDSIVEGTVKGQIVGTRGGWAYNPNTGEIWANTSTIIPGSGCTGDQNISENTW